MKRPILGFLAAVTLSFGLVGLSPAGATTDSTAATAVPAHDRDGDHDHDGYKYSHPGGHGSHHRRHPRQGDGDDDHDRGHDGRRRCAGLIVVCLG